MLGGLRAVGGDRETCGDSEDVGDFDIGTAEGWRVCERWFAACTAAVVALWEGGLVAIARAEVRVGGEKVVAWVVAVETEAVVEVLDMAE